ncbi:MAG: bifunctional [glutamine synthetase] adenylyltransferase/[glutamine synthetase]-adenylyl-L-tyrosine phosphorylase [Rhodospirillales bacterium]
MSKLDPSFIRDSLPAAADGNQARHGLERWGDALAAKGEPGHRRLADQIRADAHGAALLDSIFGNSPFLTLMAELEPVFFVGLLDGGPDAALARISGDMEEMRRRAIAGIDPGAALRRAKRHLALTTAVADIASAWRLEQVTGALSNFASAAMDTALAYLLADAAARGVILADPLDPTRGSGLIVLGMGKLGAYELNYSSDIDLIVFWDPERLRTTVAETRQRTAERLVRGLVRLMADRTRDGYVFRTDLRLRPDPGATPVAIPVLAAEEYYETLGQNWERAALIKARPVAGDRVAGAQFLRWLRPFIWRKHLDFAAIQDIHSIKRQINAYRGGARIALAGHNIKLGRGGIREIEFFAQTQQLIWGGRIPSVRQAGTIDALAALVRAGKISGAVAVEMTDAYRYLRRVEHRLQMIDDAQTHSLPEEPGKLEALALFLGYPSLEPFATDLLATLRRVESHYAELFEDAPALTLPGAVGGNLVFTGGEADPETLATLQRLGFSNVQTVDAAVRSWHHGRCRAMRSVRARELLTELVPHLLKALAAKPDPDAAFLAFDRFLTGLPAGVQLFSMFHANPPLLGLVTDILGVAPALADHLARRPSVLESVLSAADFFQPPPSLAELEAELETVFEQARDFEDLLDLTRRWANDRRFQVGVQSLKGLIDTSAATAAWSRIAEAALRRLLPPIEAEFARAHGRIDGCGMAIVGMGKLGGAEMTATSDLDLIVIYATPPEGAQSDGPRPLPAPLYFARLSQRLINAITAPTAEGRLYEVDMRLRPSGKAGPIAVSAATFSRYQLEDAWVWEQMALTRARVVAGPDGLAGDIRQVIRSVLTRRRDAQALVVDVAEMRERMAAEHATRSLWEPKHVRGGLVDIEFIAQYLQLREAHAHPSVLSQNTFMALSRLREAGILPSQAARELRNALTLWQAVQARIRLNVGAGITAEAGDDAPRALKVAADGILGLDFATLVARLQRAAADVRGHFRRIIEQPAASVGPRVAAGERQ